MRKWLPLFIFGVVLLTLTSLIVGARIVGAQDDNSALVDPAYEGSVSGAGARSPEAGVGTAFSYQGRLDQDGMPVNGSCDFKFSLFNEATGGSQQGNTQSKTIQVSDGLFSESLNFGSGVFSGSSRWLEIEVRCPSGSGSYVKLSPREEILAIPYALSLRPGAEVEGDAGGGSVLKATATSGDALTGQTNSTSGKGVQGTARTYTGVNYGVFGFTDSYQGYGGYFYNKGSSGNGVGLYARGSQDNAPDIVVGGNSDADDNGIISTSPNYSSSDLVLRSNDSVRIDLDYDGGGEDADFYVSAGGETIFKVDESGLTTVEVLEITGGADLSEQFDVRTDQPHLKPEPGMVVSIDAVNPGKLLVSSNAYDRTVAGVISGAGGVQTGMLMGHDGTIADGDYPVALTGRVYVWADASYGAIQPGDLLTTSNTPATLWLSPTTKTPRVPSSAKP